MSGAVNHPFPNSRNERLAASPDAKQTHAKLKKKGSLGSGIFTFGLNRKKGREAKPEKVIQPTAATPPPEQQRRALYGYETQEHPGGQVSYRAKSAVDVYREHFTEDLVQAAEMFLADADRCTRANVICSRTYTGMPHAISMSSLTEDQIDAQARFKWIMGGMDERFRAALSFLVMGVRSERMGAPRDFAYTASRYRDPTTKNAFTAGFLKAALIRLKEAQLAYVHQNRIRKQEMEARRLDKPQGTGIAKMRNGGV